MTARSSRPAADLETLRAEFDRSFAVAGSPAMVEQQHLLAFAVGERLLAVRLGEVARIEPLGKRVAVPGTRPELLGLGASQGRLYALFNLATLLGQPGAEAPRWSMLVAGDEPVALAFDRFDGLVRVAPGAFSRAANQTEGGALISELVRVGEGVRGVLDLRAVMDRIGRAEGTALRGIK